VGERNSRDADRSSRQPALTGLHDFTGASPLSWNWENRPVEYGLVDVRSNSWHADTHLQKGSLRVAATGPPAAAERIQNFKAGVET